MPFHFLNDNTHTSLSAVSDANLEVSKLSACVFVGVAILACPLTWIVSDRLAVTTSYT
jgi:hypothetical protein